MKKTTILKTLVTIAIFLFIFLKIDLTKIVQILTNANAIRLILTIPLVLLAYAIKTHKWNILLNNLKIKTDYVKNYAIIIVSMFYCLVTPGRAGELTRTLYLKAPKAKVIPTIILDKLLDVLVLIILTDILILTIFKSTLLITIMTIITLGYIVTIIILLNKTLTKKILRIFKTKDHNIKNYTTALHTTIRNKTAITKNIIYTIAYYAVCMIIAFLVITAFQANANPLLALSFPINVLLGNIPLTISGLGLREYVTILVFETLNADPALGLTVSLTLFAVLTLFPGLLGGILSFKAKIQ